MEAPPIPDDEATGLTELPDLAVRDTGPDPGLDDICVLTRRLAGTEIADITLRGRHRQGFDSSGWAPQGQRDPLIIPDAREDPRFADNPLVVGEPRLRFYAEFPLITATGDVVGSLCAISRRPRRLSEAQVDSLRRLAALTAQLLEHQPVDGIGLPLSPSLSYSASHRHDGGGEPLGTLALLLNRDQMLRRLELQFAMREATACSLLRCSFRDYERVHANLGVIVAEQYLNEAARRTLAALPPSASVARFADAELVVLLPLIVEEAEVQKLAEELLSLASRPYRNRSQSLPMDLSVGIAIHRGDTGSVEQILADASMAVAMARRCHGNAFRMIDSELRQQVRAGYHLELAFREAVITREIEPFLQAIVDLESGEPTGFEALARWHHQGDLLLPTSFMPLATRCGLTGEVDLLIIEKALAAMPLLAKHVSTRQMCMSCNLSATLLEDAALRRRLLALLDDNPFPSGWQLQVELLEEVFQETNSDLLAFLAALVDRGVRIAIDDFGTGYSSLSRLTSLPIQAVKLDQAFVKKIDAGADSLLTLLRTMLTMLADLGLEITAEGVESPLEREWLLRQGARKGQGTLFAVPVPISEAIAALQPLA